MNLIAPLTARGFEHYEQLLLNPGFLFATFST
jgi:hypothetical protein